MGNNWRVRRSGDSSLCASFLSLFALVDFKDVEWWVFRTSQLGDGGGWLESLLL